MPVDQFKDRPLPQWFAGAKLGLLIHYGPYTVPAWAERSGELQKLWSSKGPAHLFKHNPYAEWYLNTIAIPGSDAERHHLETYGHDYSYDNFIAPFAEASAKADFASWAELFAQAGARYVVLTTKHHDGFLLWPSRTPPPKPHYMASRDIVGGLTDAVRARGMRMGLYYSGGYDKLFNPTVVRSLTTAITAVPQSREYAQYCDAHLAELIEKYQPSILWNDIAYPRASDLGAIFERYYAVVQDGVVNERWTQFRAPRGVRGALLFGAVHAFETSWPLLPKSWRQLRMRATGHHDFSTPEYEVYSEARPKKWEAVRGLGTSFGNNRTETDADMLSPVEIVHLLVDIVSKNGNLMLGIAPNAGGTFRDEQRSRLLALGEWLSVNGEAIYGTRPWDRAEGTTSSGLPVRFTCTDGALYCIVLGTPRGPVLGIDGLRWPEGAPMRLLGVEQPIHYEQQDARLAIRIPGSLPERPAWAIKVGKT